jgi:hypothetical protein
MSKKNPAHRYDSFEVITQEDPETGDMLIPLPPQLLKDLGWKEGDEIDFSIDQNGRIIVKKI